MIENKKRLFEQAKHAHPIVMGRFEEVGHLSQVKFAFVILVDAANHRVVQTTFFGHRLTQRCKMLSAHCSIGCMSSASFTTSLISACSFDESCWMQAKTWLINLDWD